MGALPVQHGLQPRPQELHQRATLQGDGRHHRQRRCLPQLGFRDGFELMLRKEESVDSYRIRTYKNRLFYRF